MSKCIVWDWKRSQNGRFFWSIILFVILFGNSVIAQNTKKINKRVFNPTEFVNPFIGTDGHGHTYPGAQAPFGFMQLSPDTRLTGWDGCSAYHYSDTIIHGFSHTHLSGTGCSDYGDILLMPTSNIGSPAKYAFSTPFSHFNETASPGYYSVLMKNNVLAELTATSRCGMHYYTFPYGVPARVLIDLKHRDEVISSYLEIVSANEIRGMRSSKAWATNQQVYFVIRFSKPILKSEVYINDTLQKKKGKFFNAKDLKAVFDFTNVDRKSLIVKIGISGVDTTGARLNLDKEIPGWNFDQIRYQTKAFWNIELRKIEVESKNRNQLTIFYSALYHTFLSPNVYNDVDGRYRGRDGEIHKTNGWNYYTVFSLWDTYRALHPLLAIIDTARTRDFIQTFIAQWEQGGLLPMWELSGNETDCMIGYHAVPVIVDAYAKGIRGFDLRKAYQAMKTSAMQNRYGIANMKVNGFVPSDFEHESVSKTLEYGYDDWCIAQFAKLLGEESDYQYFIKRAQAYKHIFDSKTGFMRPRFNGGWYSPFNPTEVNNHYTEANSWQYSFYVPQDISGLIALHGGNANFEKKLDELFTTSDNISGRNQSDITGLIGQYAHGNEPSHHIAYLYSYIGKPEKTQQRVRQIMRDFYKNEPSGLIGNEDCGQMSAWLVMSAMGLYSVCPGSDQFVLGSPMFTKVTIHLENGKKFVISAPKNSVVNTFVNSATLNGQAFNKTFLTNDQIKNGGELTLEMSDFSDGKFGKSAGDFPSTKISEFPIVVSPIISAATRTFTDSLWVNVEKQTSNIKYYYTLDETKPNNLSLEYREPILINTTTTIKVFALDSISGNSSFSEAKFIKVPKDVTVTLQNIYNSQYTAEGPQGIIDGIFGTTNWRLGGWQGYQSCDFIAIVDYHKEKSFTEVGANFLQDTRSWIVMPKEFEVFISADGVAYQSIGLVKQDEPVENMNISTKNMRLKTDVKARFVKFVARNYGALPTWHESAGEAAFIFVDEVWAK
jgi:predicted alpha-1,2-mannosidase